MWVTGWPLREALCFAQPVGCLVSAKPSSSLGKTHAPLRTDLMQSAIYSKSFRSQCDSMVGNRSHCLTSWVSNVSHCTTVPGWERLRKTNTQASPDPLNQRLQVWGLATRTVNPAVDSGTCGDVRWLLLAKM